MSSEIIVAIEVLVLLALGLPAAQSCVSPGPGQIGPVGPKPGGGLVGILGGNVGTTDYGGGGSNELGSGISSGSELNCNNFDASCKWRNGINGIEDDHDFKRVTGSPDLAKLLERTGTSTLPSSPFLAVHPDDGRDPNERALLISAPILCQQNTGTLTFNYWLSQNVRMRVCKRRIGDVEPSTCLGPMLTGKAGPGPASISVPGQDDPFEIVIEASRFTSFEDFAFVDDIAYNADICIATTVPPINDRDACSVLQCDFQPRSACANAASAGGWQMGRGQTGNPSTGIRGDPVNPQSGTYYYTRGSSVVDNAGQILTLPKFQLASPKRFQMQYYKASYGSEIEVVMDGRMVLLNDVTTNTDREWIKRSFDIPPGEHEIEIHARRLGEFQYIAVDDFQLLNPDGSPFC